jgi:hypothetical protein
MGRNSWGCLGWARLGTPFLSQGPTKHLPTLTLASAGCHLGPFCKPLRPPAAALGISMIMGTPIFPMLIQPEAGGRSLYKGLGGSGPAEVLGGRARANAQQNSSWSDQPAGQLRGPQP